MPSSPPRLTHRERAMRRNRVFALLLEGRSAVAVAAEEGVTPRRVRQMVREALDRWDANPAQDFADLQIARLEAALRPIEQKIAAGDVTVVDKFVKVLGVLEKYHRSQLRLTEKLSDEGDREAAFMDWMERLAASRAAVAARLAASIRTGAAGAAAEAELPTPAPSAVVEVAAMEETTALAPSGLSSEVQVLDRDIAAARENGPLPMQNPRPTQIPAIFVSHISRA
jgi:hypothetical protein